MEKFFRFILNNSLVIIISVFLILAIGVYGIFKIYIDNDVLHWFSRDSSIAKLNYYVNDRFRSNNPIIIVIDFGDDVFKKENLELIKNISKLIKEEEGIVNVLSLTEVEDIKSTSEGIIVEKLFPDDITEGKLEEIKKYVMSKESYKGSLVSMDSKSVAIIALPDPEFDADKVGERVRERVEKFMYQHGKKYEVFFGGTPMLLRSISRLVINDISKLVPVVSLVVLIILFLSFRTLVGTFLPLITVLISSSIAMGIMGYLGYPLTTFGVAIPVILIAVGNAYAIHVINEYYERFNSYASTYEALIKSLLRVFVPILMSGLTTVASFISIGIGTEMNTTKNFSIVSVTGVALATLFTLTFVPAILSILKITPKHKHNEETSKFLYLTSRGVFRYRRIILVVFLIIAIISIYFITKVKIEVDYLGYFDKNTEPRVVSDKIASLFDGSFELKTYFKGNIQDPSLLKVIYIIEEEQRYFLNGKSKPQSITEIIAELNDGMVNVKTIPDSEYEVQNLWFFIEGKESIARIVSDDKYEALSTLLLGKVTSSERYALIDLSKDLIRKYSSVEFKKPAECIEDVSRLVSRSIYSRLYRAGISVIHYQDKTLHNKSEITDLINSIVLSYLNENLRDFADYGAKKRFLEKFVNYIYDTLKIDETTISRKDLEYALSPSVWNVFPVVTKTNGTNPFEYADVTGIAKLFADMEKQILNNQLTSLGIIIIAVIIMNYIAFGSLVESLISIIPIIFTLIVNFGIMGFFSIKMDFITVTIASIAVGTGIDYAIHFISRYVYEIKSGLSYEDAFYKTFSTTGKGILSNAFAVGLGFATLLLSSIVPLRNFGLLMFITMIVSSLSALTLLPVVIISLREYLKLDNSL